MDMRAQSGISLIELMAALFIGVTVALIAGSNWAWHVAEQAKSDIAMLNNNQRVWLYSTFERFLRQASKPRFWFTEKTNQQQADVPELPAILFAEHGLTQLPHSISSDALQDRFVMSRRGRQSCNGEYFVSEQQKPGKIVDHWFIASGHLRCQSYAVLEQSGFSVIQKSRSAEIARDISQFAVRYWLYHQLTNRHFFWLTTDEIAALADESYQIRAIQIDVMWQAEEFSQSKNAHVTPWQFSLVEGRTQ